MLLNALVFLALVVVLISTVKNVFASKDEIGDDSSFLVKDSTSSLRGFAIVMIAFSHICQYESSLKDYLIGGGITYTVLFSWGAIGVSVFFLLSGYGCFLSIQNVDNIVKWLFKHIIKMMIHFVVVFIPIVLIMAWAFKFDLQPTDYLINLITIRLPGSTVWYFKIQIMFYIILAIAIRINKKNACIIVAVLSLAYALIADFVVGLPDYWWKTSLCFFAGCVLAKYKDDVKKYLNGNIIGVLLLITGCIFYCIILKDSHYTFITQISAYIILAFSITLIWDKFVKGSSIFRKIGRYSLDIYLVHIGLVEGIFLMNLDLNYKITAFVILVSIISLFCYRMSEYICEKI